MEEKLFGDKKIVADIILAITLCAVALFVFLLFQLTGENGASVRVSVDGQSVAEYSLAIDGEYSLNGGTNILVIEDGEAYMKEADCPKQLCVKQGRVSKVGESIVCLENRVSVTVVGDGEILEVR
ncbi:MAG: NusG domain II-containing protein [Clostridia bacterium]|nr:NusG domain II-containing protein [Clostridia bacterium]